MHDVFTGVSFCLASLYGTYVQAVSRCTSTHAEMNVESGRVYTNILYHLIGHAASVAKLNIGKDPPSLPAVARRFPLLVKGKQTPGLSAALPSACQLFVNHHPPATTT